ncbi:MAG: hypothetical protein A3J83_00985 [Elusimicrobia bacterium RIFOXYA2_FULL_40_6]|nr:MAG: hypothetical protein A3J83_00985 [Elusimicrobia bacterium RIFOXYA2_FULL_40_6]
MNRNFLAFLIVSVLLFSGCGNNAQKTSIDGVPTNPAEAMKMARTSSCTANMKKMGSGLAILISDDSGQTYRTLSTVNGSALWDTLASIDKTGCLDASTVKCPVTGKTYRGPINSSKVGWMSNAGDVVAMCEGCGNVLYGRGELYNWPKDSKDFQEALSATTR